MEVALAPEPDDDETDDDESDDDESDDAALAAEGQVSVGCSSSKLILQRTGCSGQICLIDP